MRGPRRKQLPKVWQRLLLAVWSHHGWLSSPWPCNLWCPWAGAACARLLPRQPRDKSQALVILAAETIPPWTKRSPCIKAGRIHPGAPSPRLSFQDSTAPDRCEANITARPRFPNWRLLTLSSFTSDICLTAAASQEGLSRKLPTIHLTNSKAERCRQQGWSGWDTGWGCELWTLKISVETLALLLSAVWT